jgi:hypothetical protein
MMIEGVEGGEKKMLYRRIAKGVGRRRSREGRGVNATFIIRS